MQHYDMIINGQNCAGDSSLEVINPATGTAFASVARSSEKQVNEAVAAARVAFKPWSQQSSAARKQLCQQLAQAMEDNMAELMQLVTLESGKPLQGLNGIGSGMEVGGAIAWTRYTAELELPVDVVQDDDKTRIEVHRKPLGVVASITPWNWPLMIAIWHVIPALRVGNTVVIKPSEFTPVATTRLVQLANEILPAGVLNIVNGEGDVGAALTSHPDVNKIVFTGSTATGKRIMATASASLKRVTLELGGNDAGIVLPDANISAIVPKLFAACFHNNGQTCAALKRLYVHESQYEDVCQQLAQLAKTVKVGSGLEDGVELGPIQNAKQLAVVQELADSARSDGGRFLAGGEPLAGGGYFFAPTIVADLSDGSRLVDEEPFGPILPVIKYSDVDEVIARANQNDRGLGGSIWSSDIDKATGLAQQLECGTVWVNEHGAIQPNAPFGGIKQSGMGVEFGLYGLEEYTSIQTVKVPKR
ncbi:MAG: aldehyde dehydrogenase family protein [Gammaproteobacteria bacterium]|uniref:aldehyde dehydrogenase family protein n=1 Tax=Pseudomaricurvus alcaniphilus TaxID=1166482 RepID=UPI00140D1FDA|nr:aldehyde dehydrogenase family protein [Pseudomaricurvus alcaniphilus]MBR9910084.1 aldehyde dehydrogenase family protein [Gammaproteobacteria bacterium]NHN36600.1 aldehyde dehydrogenase family protein [Pseudomaricurvus alcaniphilus]